MVFSDLGGSGGSGLAARGESLGVIRYSSSRRYPLGVARPAKYSHLPDSGPSPRVREPASGSWPVRRVALKVLGPDQARS